MSLFIASIASGSNGNCYYVGNGTDAVLIDAGISCRETEKRMAKLGLSPKNVKGIFISHEHSDHIRGVTNLSKKHQIPVYVTPDTRKYCRMLLYPHLANTFSTNEPIQLGGLTITAFLKYHDAIHPHSFIVEGNGVTIGSFTDIGACCDRLATHFSKCHAAFLESNYDAAMLETGRYPVHLKNRIRGGHGHLSNAEALDVFKQHKPPHMSHLLLSHLSKENNRPDIVAELFNAHADGVNITVASRYEQSELIEVTNGGVSPKEKKLEKLEQAVLF